ncbi:hypothetical protein [Kitasatospora sp. NPDC088134]|uniref:hypothetical protein n=1 Tax=Kitasatospora sp. NPDC088134 TaxID=3364071 RepID=UPI00380F27C0
MRRVRRGWWRIGLAVALCVGATGTAAVASGVAPFGGRPTAVRAEGQPAPDDQDGLQVVSATVDRAEAQGLTVVRALVANLGPDPVTKQFTTTVRLPKGVTVEGQVFPDGCRVEANGRQLACRFRKGLGVRRTATVLVPLRVEEGIRPGERLAGTVSLQDPDRPGRSVPDRAFSIDVQ